MARSIQSVKRGCRALYNIIFILYSMGAFICSTFCIFSANVCSLCLWLWNTWSKFIKFFFFKNII